MFKRIEIKNFRTCEDVVLENMGNVLALLGRNGAGKTNILTAIAWAARSAVSSDSARLSQLPTVSLEISLVGASYVYDFSFERRVEFHEGKPREIMPTLRESLSLAKAGMSAEVLVTRENESVRIGSLPNAHPLRIGMPVPMLTAMKALLASEDLLLQHIIPVGDFLNKVRYFGIDSDFLDQDDKSVVRQQDYTQWLSNFRSTGDAGQSLLMRIVHMFHEQKDRFAELGNLLGEKLGVIDRISVLPISQPNNGQATDVPSIQVVYFTPTHTTDAIPFNALSYGTRRLLRMVVLLVFDESSVLLIEQPEDGIHAGLTEKLVGLLRAYANPAQMILATHSTVLLNQLHPDEVRLVTLDGGKTAIRSLSDPERSVAQKYLNEDGTLSEFLSLVEEG